MIMTLFMTARKNRLEIMRAVPWSFLFSRVMTGLGQILFPLFLYHYFFHGECSALFREYAGSDDYMTYVVLGAAFNTLAVASLMNVSRALITELRQGTLEPLILSPMSRPGYFLGCLAEQTSRALVEFAIVLIAGYICGADLRRVFDMDSITVILLAILSFFCVGLALSSVMLTLRNTYLTQNTLFNLMSLTCGIMFPIQYLPDWVQSISGIFPLTYAVTLFRRVVMNNELLTANFDQLIPLLVISGVYLLAGILSYKRIERRFMEDIFA